MTKYLPLIKKNEGYAAGCAYDLFIIDRQKYMGKLLQRTDFQLGKTSTLICYCNHYLQVLKED